MKYSFYFAMLLALIVTQGCSDSTTESNRAKQVVTNIRLMSDTMGGNEAEASNGIMTLRVRGLYQQMFSGDWYMGIKLMPLSDITISKVTCSSFNGKNIQLKDYENRFVQPAGYVRKLVEREVDIPFTHPTALMLITFYDQNNNVLGKFKITHIVDHLIGGGLLPAENREVYENAK